MKFIKYSVQDFGRNKDIKIKYVLFLFRLTSYFDSYRLLYYPLKFLYKLSVEYLLSIELPINTKIGKGLKIEHGCGLVVNQNTEIGDYVSLKHNTTIGCKTNDSGKCVSNSIIGNNVTIHPHSCIIGSKIGENTIVGAGSVVVKDIPKNKVYAGNPAKEIRNR